MCVRRCLLRDPVTGKKVYAATWNCEHVNAEFPKEPPPPWGRGYDDEFPPSKDPCWEDLAAPLAEKLGPWMEKWGCNKSERMAGTAWVRWILQASSWLELRGYVTGVLGSMELTPEGVAWLEKRRTA